ncbi:MAG: hypothetical protein Q4D94_14765 [Bacillota bacterium]|nr:hypothetical protein [Bacillota bacterium]
MAQYINMQQTEYDEIQTKLAAIHEEILTGEETIRNKIIELTQIEGGFYVALISTQVHSLLSTLEGYALEKIKESFEMTEQTISAFADAVIQIDVVDE